MRKLVTLAATTLVCGIVVPAVAAAQPIDRVFIIVMENAEFGSIIGNPSAPYLNSLAAAYGLATNYTGVSHPSLPNYMSMTGGNTFFTTDCVDCRTDAPNIVDRVEASGRSWKAYMEGMSAPCGAVDEGLYVARHNPFVHYSDIADNPARCARIRPFTEFSSDLSTGALPNYVWITPNLCNDMHDCGVSVGDQWLQATLSAIVQSPSFQNAAVFITWDEGTTTTGGGGQVPLLVVSPRTPAGVRSSAAANHYNLLRTIESFWGLAPLGQSESARPLTEFFNLLEQPGFESYRPPALGAPGWVSDAGRQSASFSETHQPHRGSINGACWTPANQDCGMYQVVTAPSSGTYALTVFANSDRAGGLVGANVNGALAASVAVQSRGFGNYGEPYTMRFPASAGSQIVVWMYSPGVPGYVVVDDFALTLVDSAVTAANAWTSLDIGQVGIAGSSTYSNGSWTIGGAGGAAIWGTADAFRFVYRSLSGDGQVTARVDSLQNTSPFAKAGVMIRDGVGAGAANVVLDVRPTGDVEFMQRMVAGGTTVFYATARAAPPSWLRLARSGSSITASVSTDGLTWTVVGTTTAAMSSSVNAGVIVTSNDSTRLNTAMFEGVSVTVAPWFNADVGAAGLIGNAQADAASITVDGGGPAGVWGSADAFHFVYRPLSGDGEIVARLTSMQNTSAYAKAGLMMRDSLSPSAPEVILDVRPTSDVEFMQRAVAGGSTTFLATASAPLPYWLRLKRTGSTVTASVSSDGSIWTTVGSTTVAMSTTIYVGVAVCSVNGVQIDHAVLDNISVR